MHQFIKFARDDAIKTRLHKGRQNTNASFPKLRYQLCTSQAVRCPNVMALGNGTELLKREHRQVQLRGGVHGSIHANTQFTPRGDALYPALDSSDARRPGPAPFCFSFEYGSLDKLLSLK
eukprot:scpid69251/ scgid0542/ 